MGQRLFAFSKPFEILEKKPKSRIHSNGRSFDELKDEAEKIFNLILISLSRKENYIFYPFHDVILRYGGV